MTGTARITTGGRITRSTTKDSQQNLTETVRPKRGRKPKNSNAVTTTTQIQETTTINQQPPEEVKATEVETTEVESSQPVVTGPKRGRKPKNKTAQIIEASDTTTEATTSNSRGKKRKTTTEDNNGEAEESPVNQKKTKTKKSTEKKATKPSEKPVEEVRQAKFRTVCTGPIRERIHRAESQRIYMVSRKTVSETQQEFAVLGSTGNVYNVTISHVPNCTCPDFLKGNLCKHIIFVYLRVCRLSKNSSHIYQKALLTEELKSIFANAAPDPAILANKRVRDRFEELNSGETSKTNDGRRPIEGDCPICYELLEEEKNHDKIVWCKECGNNLHKDCFEQWKKSKRGATVTCVYCRSAWRERIGEATVNEEGYVNLGTVQGMSTERDTSTYYKPRRYREGSYY